MEVDVRLVGRGEVSVAASLLARAFAADPFLGYFMASPRRRRLALPAFFRAALLSLFDARAIYVSERGGSIVGVAAWLPPGLHAPSAGARLRSQFASTRVRLLFPRAAPRVSAGFATPGTRHPAEPHWYLAFVGIDPVEQGRGLGRQLLAPVLEQADREHEICYLETPFPDVRSFYYRLHFQDTAELRPVAGAPPVWTMTRQPFEAPALGRL